MIELEPNHIWEPIPGSSQELALDTRCNITLYTGQRGPGKTDTQLMRFRRRVGLGYGAFWKGVIFDEEYKNLGDLVAKSKRWFNAFNDGAKFLESLSAYKWVWPTGEELLFRAVDRIDDYWSYHGHEYPYIGWNELTKYATGELFDMMMSVNRSSFTPEKYPITIDGDEYSRSGKIVYVRQDHRYAEKSLLPSIPLEVFATCNPYGIGHGWVKRRFIDPAPYGHVLRTNFEVISPATKEKVIVEKTQIAIFGSYVENIYLDPQYIATLHSETDPNRRKAWLTGSWDIVAGGGFDDVWHRSIHVVPRFIIPSTWYLERSFDWGSSTPFSVGFWAISDGTEATIIHNGEEYSFCPHKGSLIRFFEWYGSEIDLKTNESTIGTNKGLKLSASAIAQGIADRETSLLANGWIKSKVSPGPADNQIRDTRESDVDTIEDKMAAKGIRWTRSDKSAGSRKIGMDLIRELLINAVKGEGPGLYFMDNCRIAISILPILPRDKKIMDDIAYPEDHVYDDIRYEALKNGRSLATELNISLPS